MRGSGPRPVVRRGQPARSGPSSQRAREQRLASARVPGKFARVHGATPEEIGMTLADFATQVPADQEIVEIGVHYGRTALLMAWGAKQGNGAHVTAIDPWDTPGNVYDPPFTDTAVREQAYRHVHDLGYSERIRLIWGFSQHAAEHWAIGYREKQVGLLFVDGDHSYEGAKRDIELWAPHLAPGAVIAVDDYNHPDWPGVAQAVDELVDNGLLEPIQIFHEHLAVTKLRAAGVAAKAITSEGVSPEPVSRETGSGSAGAVVGEGEIGGVSAGTLLDDLNLGQLRTVARARRVTANPARLPRAELLKLLKGEAPA